MKLKEKYKDFKVEEVYTNIPEGQKYCIFILEKQNWTTLKAVEAISKRMLISVKRFNIAGQKDRRGITRQYVSCEGIGKLDLSRVKLKDIKLEFVTYSSRPVRLGGLDKNKFTIVARELKNELKEIKYVPNYYDDQRFGGFRPNLHLIGKEVLRNNYEEAVKLMLLYPFEVETDDYKEARKDMEKNWGDWFVMDLPRSFTNEKKIIGYLEKNPTDFKGALQALPRHLFSMITQAYQSYIYNVTLSKYLERFKCRKVSYSLGELNFCEDYINLDWPLVGFKSKLEGEVKEIFEKFMKEENIWYEDFNHEISKLASSGLMRKAMIRVDDLKLGKLKNNELGKGKKQEVSFSLPKGSYATIVMKAMDQ